MPRYLTKSRFITALECPTKLYYTKKPQYPDTKSENEFLMALAKGGYQVGELAKCYYPSGIDIETLDYDDAITQTDEHLKKENIILYEAAIQYDKFFVRADILEKKGNSVNLIEVKSKSFDGNSSLDLLNKGRYVDTGWKKYVYDVAFQKHVLSLAKPEWNIKAYLLLADKNSIATVDGLNQKFLFKENETGRTYIDIVGDVSEEGLGEKILRLVNVDDLCEKIYNGTDSKEPLSMPFADYVDHLADNYWNDIKITIPVHKDCGKCEFQATNKEEEVGKLSGYKECFKKQLGWTVRDFQKPTIFDIWDFRNKQKVIDDGIIHMDQLKSHHIGKDAESSDITLSRQTRQWLQVKRTVTENPEPFIDTDGIKREMSNWKYPLHMIDFETSTVAIPFYRGMRPYEDIAFQFSHHIIYENGKIEHKGQYLNAEQGVFPNFFFVRKLKDELSQDKGSVFRYAAHENTILNHIQIQLQNSNEDDKYDLIEFIKTITHSANHCGERDMIDLLEIVKHYYWHPSMKGSNSLKAVLPAVLNSSQYIKEKYSKPIYGKNSEIRSLNFDDNWCWIKMDDQNMVISPYKLLPNLFDDINDEQIDELLMGDRLADGGAAMTAYAMMQFTEMSESEREQIIKGLLRYCELDTLAMVFLWEYFNNL